MTGALFHNKYALQIYRYNMINVLLLEQQWHVSIHASVPYFWVCTWQPGTLP